jgi:hypothetical protein
VIIFFSLLLILILITQTCTHQTPRINSSGQPQREYVYHIPEKIADGWEISSLEDEGINSEKVVELMKDILNEKYKNVHSVLLVANEMLI